MTSPRYPRRVREFAVYTALRMLLFVATYAVIGGIGVLVWGQGTLLVSFLLAVVVSAVLSVKLLKRQRDAFALKVQRRAEAASSKMEERRSREDVD